MADEIPVNVRPQRDTKADVIIPIGDQSAYSKEKDVKFDTNYEDMAEDFIDTFNNACNQGMLPIQVLYSQASAFSIVLGCFIRAGLKQAEVGKLLMMVGRNAAVSSQSVQIVQNQTVGEVIGDVTRNNEPKVQ
jgi:hypothetical protein